MKRSVVSVILLTIFTFGLYSLYWLYKVSKEVNELTNDNKNNPFIDLVLSIFTLGLYTIYWFYKIGRQIEEYEEIIGMKKSSIAILTVIIAIVLVSYGGGIISMGIIQNEINKVLDEKISF